MKIHPDTQSILHALETHPQTTAHEIAKITGLRAHVVRYVLHTLVLNRQLRCLPLVDVYPLGYQHYGCYFSVAAQQKEKAKSFLSAMVQSRQVAWLAEVGGNYQYALAIVAKNPLGLIHFFNEYAETFGDIFFAKSIATRISYTQFNRKYFLPKSDIIYEVTFGSATNTIHLDDIDQKILRILTKKPFLTPVNQAKQLALPLSTFNYRIAKLEKQRIITGYTYEIDIPDLRMHHFSLFIQVNGVGKPLSDKLLAFARQHPHIRYFLQCIGEWDFEIGAEVARPEDIILISQALYKQFGHDLVSINILPIFRYLKLSYYPF